MGGNMEWRKLYSYKLHYLYFSPHTQVIKSRGLKYAGRVACMVDKRGLYRVLVGNLRERDYLEHLGID
jgi:hypothetical protein